VSDVRRSFILSFADSYLAIALQLASTVIISRLLKPAEVGVFAIAAAFSTLASTFRDFGMGEYLIQARDLDHTKIRAAFGLNVVVSWSMAALMFAGAPAAAAFYREEGVGDVMRVLALSFLIVPFGAVVQYWFRRQLNYKPIVIGNAISNISAFIVSVSLAWSGHSYMSLAWSTFAGILATVVVASYYRPSGFPRWPGVKGIREVFDFGKYTTAMYLLAQLGRGAPELIIGRVMDVAHVGMFSRANGLVELFRRLLLRPVWYVSLPYFARAQREKGVLAPAYVDSIGLLTVAGWPLLAYLALTAYSVVRIVYGTQWLDAVPFARILCLACAAELFFFLSREALLACGAARPASVLQMQILALQLLALFLVVPYGLAGASWGLVIAALGGVAAAHWHLHHAFGLRFGAILRVVRTSFMITIWTVGPLAIGAVFVPITEANFWAWTVIGSVAAAALWLSGLRAFRHPLWPQLKQVARRIFVHRRAGPERKSS
jgi:O-antigen/teichoic acid export membrane protein